MTRLILPALQETIVLSPLHHIRPLATSALPDAPVVPEDDRRTPRFSPGGARRAFAALRG
jgi:hypothetical protein